MLKPDAVEQPKAIFRRILVAVDGTETSKDAVRLAASLTLAMGVGSELTILHVVTEPSAVYESGLPLIDVETGDRTAGDSILGEAASLAGERAFLNIKKAIARSHDSPVKGIAEYARMYGVDLIVVGTHDRAGLERLLLGSVASGVVKEAPCSVLVVKPGSSWGESKPRGEGRR
jgi:nucleotide-binding universal stress UspA family protein